MNNAEKEALARITKAMRDDEKRYSPRFIPTEYLQEELDRRGNIVNNALTGVWDVVQKFRDDMTLAEAQSVLAELRSIVRGA